ncbi:hypothetical protein B0A49_00676 [Cryomyces minteri]|uniref:Uncharacterized protein n=1 Tax=Cryomyces minteri TaxID=331657 RepID=A0A4U0XX61_9PEZI|nr:hypothetical protein B0A49_00676 [Cryomyces minteri]
MSGPSNYQTPRSSTSSQPSVTSSSTLHTRYSGFHLEPGGPSSPSGRADQGISRLSDKDGDYASEQPGIGQNGNGYLGDNSAGNSRRYRPRRSGGFLLESAFSSSPDAAAFGEQVERRQNDLKGKGRRDNDRLHVEKRRSTNHRLSGHGSSPLAREFTRAAPTPGGADVEDRENLQTSVPLPTVDRNASFEPGGEDSGLHRRQAPGGLSAYGNSPRAPALNPADLVNMALNLNETGWNNTAKVLAWVNAVEERAERPEYRVEVDSVSLPPFGVNYTEDEDSQFPSPKGHRRTDTVTSKPKGPRMNWITHPSDLLADAFWLEQEDNNHKDGKEATDTRDPSSAVTRFLKSGRIGELVRNEGSRMGDFIWRKDSPADDATASDASLGLPDSSDTEDNEATSRTLKKRPNPLSRSTASYEDKTEAERGRMKPKYYMNNLPTFKPASNSKRHSPSVSPGKQEDDHILRQQLAQRDQRRPSRFERLAPPGLDLSNISPSSSSPDLARVYSQTTNGSTIDDRRNSYGFTISRSRSRDNYRLGFPGEVGRKGPAMSGLAGLGVSANSGSSRPGLKGKRHWSISDRAPQVQHAAVTQHDIAHVRALLLSSGIKAREIKRRAHSVRSPAPSFLLKASQVTSKPLYPVARKEEHVLAARLLSNDLAAVTTAFEATLTRFCNATAPRVSSRLSALHDLVVEDLTPRVHQCADDADAFTAEMTTSYTLAIKQVNDSVDLMLRTRRRRLKWIRKVGFVLLEWLLLGVMWCVWLLFVLVRMVKGVVVGFARGIAWVLWL